MKYPSLKIVVPHGCWPHVHKALALAIRCPNVYLMPDCYLYIHNFPLSEEYVIAANTYLKYRILYASSYPVRSLEQALEFIDTDELLEVTPESLRIRKKILDSRLRKRQNMKK